MLTYFIKKLIFPLLLVSSFARADAPTVPMSPIIWTASCAYNLISQSCIGSSSGIPASSSASTSAANYNLGPSESIVYVNTTSNAVAIHLTSPAVANGSYRSFHIKDIGGNLSTNNLTLVRFASEKIENVAATKTFSTNFGSWLIISDGTNWWIL